MHNFPRPDTPTVRVNKEPVAGNCPSCNEASLSSYRILSEGGWWDVIKCQHCLTSVERKPGPLLGTFSPFSMNRGG
jgi:transcription elongation factor Elf1